MIIPLSDDSQNWFYLLYHNPMCPAKRMSSKKTPAMKFWYANEYLIRLKEMNIVHWWKLYKETEHLPVTIWDSKMQTYCSKKVKYEEVIAFKVQNDFETYSTF